MGTSHTSYYLRTDIASELQNLVLERIGEYAVTKRFEPVSIYMFAQGTYKYIQVQRHMVRNNHIELVTCRCYLLHKRVGSIMVFGNYNFTKVHDTKALNTTS